MKQCCGAERAQVRKAVSIRGHLQLCLRAFLRLEVHRLRTGMSGYEAKLQIIRVAGIWNDTLLIERIVQGWKPEDDLGIPSVKASTIDEKPLEISTPDSAALEQLRSAGSDKKVPHRLVHYLYFPERQSALRAGQALETEGFVVEVRPSAEGESWLVLASHSVEPVAEKVEEVRLRLEKLAVSLGGEYDGWEAEVIR